MSAQEPVKISVVVLGAQGTLTTSPTDKELILSDKLSNISMSYGVAEGTAVREIKNLTIDSFNLTADGIGLRGSCDPNPARSTVKVSVEEVRALRARLAEIDAYQIENIVWTENDNVIVIDPKVIADWKFVGLSNSYFPHYNHPLRRT